MAALVCPLPSYQSSPCVALLCPHRRDVLNVLGMYPGDPGPPGGDCAGVVVATGEGVSRLRPGDAVFGLAGGSLGSHVFTNAQTLAHVRMLRASCCRRPCCKDADS